MEKINSEDVRNPRRWIAFDAAFVVLIMAIAVAVAFIIMLARQNAELKDAIAQTEGTLSGSHSARPGDIVPGFKTVGLAGQPMEIVYDGSKRFVIYIFSPRCDVCVSELSNWNRIAGEAVSQNYKVLGISIDSLEDSHKNLVGTELLFDISIMPNMSLQRAYRVVSVPETLIVSSNGMVDWVHYGAMTRQTTEEMLAKIRSGP